MIGDRLKQLRKEKGVLQKDVADYLGITGSAYGFYEQGKRQPDPETLQKLATYFNCSIDYLVGKNDNLASNLPVFHIYKKFQELGIETLSPEDQEKAFNSLRDAVELIKYRNDKKK